MARVTEMRYPNGWVEYYTYDKMGRLLAVDDTHPSEKPAKTQKHTYEYDANGNMTYEYMRGNGTGQAKNETLYTYDALNRLITAHDDYGNSTRTYTYDSLGNLTYETGVGSHNCDYIYNNLNQQIDRSSDNWNSHTISAYDKRGNLILEEYIKNSKVTTAGAYTYDETNKMVRGINGNAEESIYTYNGLGALMEQTWIIAKNGYGYHDVSATAVVDGEVVVDSVTGKRQQKVRLTPEELEAANAAAEAAEAASAETGITETSADANTLTATLVTYGNAANGNNGNSGNGNGTQDKPTGSDVKNTSTVVKQFVVDFSSETYKPLMEHEVNGLDYRYVYSDKARLSVVVQGIETGSASLLDDAGELHAYYHCDYLGTTDYLTSAVNSKVISWTSYSEWGEITHNAVLKCGQRELDLVKEYATHDFDAVLNMYYAKARFYDADNRRFVALDPILDPSQYDLREYVTDPMQLVQYLYVKNNAVNWIDLLGLNPTDDLLALNYKAGDRVALRNVFESIGGEVTWENRVATFEVSAGKKKLKITVNEGNLSKRVSEWMGKEVQYVGQVSGSTSGSIKVYKSSGTNYADYSTLLDYFKKVWCETPQGPQEGTTEWYMDNLKKNYASSKLNDLITMGTVLLSEGYDVEFVAGVLANIQSEGTVGQFEYANYDSNPQSEPGYITYMNQHYNYRYTYAGKNITQVNLSDVESLLNELETTGWQGKFGLGVAQWTGSRTKTLVQFYRKEAGTSNFITSEQVRKAEALMMSSELSGNYKSVYLNWKADIVNVNAETAANKAGYTVCMNYEKPDGMEAKASERGRIAEEIYKAMTKE